MGGKMDRGNPSLTAAGSTIFSLPFLRHPSTIQSVMIRGMHSGKRVSNS